MLLVADDPRDATTVVEALRAVWPTGLLVTQAQRVGDIVEELAERGATCVLLMLDDSPGSLGALRELGTADADAPVIAISDGDDDALGLAAVTAGAQDHLARAELTPARLRRAIRYAVERKRAQSGLARQALADPLTGLPNRVLFGDRLGVALDRSQRTGLAPAVMFLDVDAFKSVNDSLGHAAGDRLLTVLAARFGELLRPMDTVARLGGDEFTFLMEGLSGEAEALTIAQRIREAAAQPIDLGGDGPTTVSVSIGIAMLDESTIAVEDAIGHADAAMYRAKHLGGSRAELFGETAAPTPAAPTPPASSPAPAPSEPAAPAPTATATTDDEQALAAAIRTGQLRVHYQPRVSIDGTTGLVGFEALVRWQHPEHGLIAPAGFIDLAERTGLIAPLGDWVLEQSLRQVRRWRQSRPGMTISVNLSAAQLADPALADRLGESMRRTGADPSVLWLEVDQAALAGDAGSALAALQRLHHVGVRLAIDDVGRDAPPTPELAELPIDMLKIDRSLVSGEAAGDDGDAVIGAVVDLSHALGLDVVAEGVETDAQLAHLRELGCDGAQGYLFSRPVPETAVRELLGV